MAKSRDHARVHTDIWGDDDWMDLSVDAQLLYLTLYTSPALSLCGAGQWHVGKLKNRAGDWTDERIEDAAGELSTRLFVMIDADTEEFLIRSWIKHDGLWRTPNMAVSVANARADLASRALRGVVVFEVLKLRDAHPDSSSWTKPPVMSMLAQNPVNPAELTPYKGGSNGGPKGGSNPTSKGASKGYESIPPTHRVNGASNGAPTTSTSTSIKRGAAQTRSTQPKASRIPDGWEPTPEVTESLRKECPTVDLAFELRKFVDYWRGKSGRDATKVDWDATWRNWVRRSWGGNATAAPRTDGFLGEAKPGGLWTER